MLLSIEDAKYNFAGKKGVISYLSLAQERKRRVGGKWANERDLLGKSRCSPQCDGPPRCSQQTET